MVKYNLKEDHKNIKKQIKGWEIEIDELAEALRKKKPNVRMGYIKSRVVARRLESISNEMMAINI